MEDLATNNPLIPDQDKESAEFAAWKEWANEAELADMITDNIDDPLAQKFTAMLCWQAFSAGSETAADDVE